MKPIKTFDKERIVLNLAKLKKGGEMFEVIIDPDKIIEILNNKHDNVKDALLYEKVFYDAKKGQEASEEHMFSLFATKDPVEVAKIIIKEGEIQFTQEYREQKRKEKRNRIIEIIVRNAIDPRNGFPHPRTRIESAMEEAKVRIDEIKPAEDQVSEIVSSMKPILPIKLAMKDVEVNVPPKFAGKAYSVVERYGKVMQGNWKTDGSWIGTVEIPAGIQNEFFDALNKLTHGDFTSRVVREK
jgi:ribosome maturation protein SDO1